MTLTYIPSLYFHFPIKVSSVLRTILFVTCWQTRTLMSQGKYNISHCSCCPRQETINFLFTLMYNFILFFHVSFIACRSYPHHILFATDQYYTHLHKDKIMDVCIHLIIESSVARIQVLRS